MKERGFGTYFDATVSSYCASSVSFCQHQGFHCEPFSYDIK